MVKVSITLPNHTQITFESEEPEVIPEMVGKVLRDLPRELLLSAWPANDGATPPPSLEESNGVSAIQVPGPDSGGTSSRNSAGPEPLPPSAAAPGNPSTPANAAKPSGGERTPSQQSGAQVKRPPQAAESEFIDFCRSANPLGDMRRVVVAAEGASRFLGTTTVDANELGRLFDLAAWSRPHSFTQTLRNAARRKFRWLERIPGRSGHYAVTDLGRATALQH